ncbi:SH3 domain-containing protein [Neglecta sp. X4]|nr:SH3 domain-containing protein [Neglectibacter sp. 59]NBJ72382.1 SH3 domain-containing protein [Neglectibacter sp. X4]NCE80157.1 SH3 domain-containing protein [Neglectibacter sp. X58]
MKKRKKPLDFSSNYGTISIATRGRAGAWPRAKGGVRFMKRWMCLVLGLCMTAALLSACGEDDKKNDSSLPSSSGTGSSTVTPIAVSPSPTPEQMAKAVKVKADDGLNVRSKGSTDGDKLGLAKNGSKLALLVEDEKDGWYQVSYNGKAAYVSAEYVEVVEVTLDEYNKLKEEAGKDSKTSGKDEDKDNSASSKEEDSSLASSGGDDEDGE